MLYVLILLHIATYGFIRPFPCRRIHCRRHMKWQPGSQQKPVRRTGNATRQPAVPQDLLQCMMEGGATSRSTNASAPPAENNRTLPHQKNCIITMEMVESPLKCRSRNRIGNIQRFGKCESEYECASLLTCSDPWLRRLHRLCQEQS